MIDINSRLMELPLIHQAVDEGMWSPADNEAIKQLIREVVEEIKPEYLEQTKEEADTDWFYGYGYNAAIGRLETKIKELGL